MAPLSGEWLEALKGEFHQPYYIKLYKLFILIIENILIKDIIIL